MSTLPKYSVLLLYPDYERDERETYLAHVTGRTVAEAVRKARREVAFETFGIEMEPGDENDWKVLAVFGGFLVDVGFNKKGRRL